MANGFVWRARPSGCVQAICSRLMARRSLCGCCMRIPPVGGGLFSFLWIAGMRNRSKPCSISAVKCHCRPTSTVMILPMPSVIKRVMRIGRVLWRHQRQDFISVMNCWLPCRARASDWQGSPCMWGWVRFALWKQKTSPSWNCTANGLK